MDVKGEFEKAFEVWEFQHQPFHHGVDAAKFGFLHGLKVAKGIAEQGKFNIQHEGTSGFEVAREIEKAIEECSS